jgi:hypothetical protein
MLHPIPFPLDEVPKFPIDYPAIQYLLNYPFFLSLNYFRRRRRFRTTAGNRIRNGRGQFDDIEDGVKAFHGQGETKTVSPISDFLDNRERAQTTMGKFLRWPSCPNIFGVKVNLVSGLIFRSSGPFPVIISSHVVLRLSQCRLRLLQSVLHTTRELVHRFQMRRRLIRFKTHPGNTAGIEEKRNLSRSRVNVIVVLKLCKGKELVPIILPLIDKDTEILLELLINPFRLSVALRMICRGSRQFDSEESIQLLSELGNKLRAAVR